MPKRSAVLLAVSFACGAAHGSGPPQALPDPLPYAPVKERVCSDCPLPTPGFRLPHHAVVVGSWGFFSDGSDYRVLDLDSGKLVQAFVPGPAVPWRRSPKSTRKTVVLPRSALPELVELANRIWAEPRPIRSHSATDVSWNLWLIDGKQVRHEAGTGLPVGLAAEWIRRINKLLGVDDPGVDETSLGK